VLFLSFSLNFVVRTGPPSLFLVMTLFAGPFSSDRKHGNDGKFHKSNHNLGQLASLCIVRNLTQSVTKYENV